MAHATSSIREGKIVRSVLRTTLIALTLALLPAQAIAATPQNQSPSSSALVAPELPQPKPQKAERPDRSGALTSAANSCATVRSRIDALAAEGQKTVACIAPAPAHKPSVRKAPTSDASALADRQPVPLPDWCYDLSNGDGTWYHTRSEACSIDTLSVDVINIPSGELVGQIYYQTNEFVYTAHDMPTWGHQVIIRMYGGWGQISGTKVEGAATCDGQCTLSEANVDFPAQSVSVGSAPWGDALPTSTATAAGAIGEAKSTMYWVFTNPSWTKGTDLIGSQVVVPVRCDNATKGVTKAGCVFKDYAPVNVVSLSGLYPNYARHIQDAQASGLPGAYPDGQPLTRQTSDTAIASNRTAACPQASSGGYPRPTGYSCDEYPFASTHQGAASNRLLGRTFTWCQISTLTSRTGPGWSACMIPANENTAAGREDLRVFYNENRVLENDAFYVWIVQ
ncbi:NucA/NucB deoxyribonuclease domain-containing protein [Streptomyces sp. NPDC004166]